MARRTRRLDEECPRCGAAPGARCRYPKGPATSQHAIPVGPEPPDRDGTDPNPYEEQARARKAYRLSRVILRVLRDARPGLPLRTVRDFREVPQVVRDRVADEAGTKPPGRRTWEIACDLAEEDLRGRAHLDDGEPF